MLHTKDRPYPCSECKKCFRSSNNLREHFRIHTGERPYKCRVCEQTFTTSGTRGRHENIHGAAIKLLKTGKKSYACTRCPEQFSGAAARIKHMKKNHRITGQYFCIQCDIELASVEELLSHHEVAHSAEKGNSNGVSSLVDEHEDHAYYRYPLNDVAKSCEGLGSNGPQSTLLSKRSKGYSQIQRKSLLKLRKICLKARKRNAVNGSEFICRYCGDRFSKLPLFLKHLWKHSKAKSEMMVDSNELVKQEIEEEEVADVLVECVVEDDSYGMLMSEEVEVVEGSDIIIEDGLLGDSPDATISVVELVNEGEYMESEIVDSKCQSLVMSSKSLPIAELRKENADSRHQGTSEEANNLELLVEELILQKYDYELQEGEQLQVKTETVSPRVPSGNRFSLPDQPSSQTSYVNNSSHALEANELDGISSNHGEIVLIRADNFDAIYDESVYHNNNPDNALSTVCPNYTESNPETVSFSSVQTSIHVADLINRSQVFCELCGKRVKNLDENEAFACTECDQLFSSLQQLQDSSDNDALESLSRDVQDGMRQKPKHKSDLCRKTYACSHCNAKFITKKMWNFHKTTCSEEKPLECDASSADNSALAQSKPSVPYPCTVCSRPFAFKYRLERHMLTHTGEKPFKCKECGKAYTSKEYLKSHTARHFNEYTHLCSTCGKSFADRLAWRLHKRVHEIAKRTKSLAFREYMCWLCGFQFRHASNLTKHLQRHRLQDQFPYKCGECEQKFRTKEGIRFHVGTHALDKPYLCMECPKAFPDAWCLKIHARSHTKLGSFECAVCCKKYRTMSSLRMHSRLHSDLRYTCKICGETFGFSRKYRSHIIKHRPPFQCEVCGVTTTRAAGLRKHKKRFQHFQ